MNVCRVKLKEAAAAIADQAVFPDFAPGLNGTDWNDLAQMQGWTGAVGILCKTIAITAMGLWRGKRVVP